MANTNKKIILRKQVTLDIEDIIARLSTWETAELQELLQKIGHLIARRKYPNFSEAESELLLKINKAIPTKLQEQFRLLSDKMNYETITDAEHKELLKLVDKLEAKNVKRLEYLIDLARIRNISLDEVMKQLQLNVPNLEE